VSELPVHNFIFQHSRRHCPNIYLVLESASISPSHRILPPALWTTSWLLLALHHHRRTFSQRDVSLGEETSGNRWAWSPDCTADDPTYLTWIFPEAQWWSARNGAARCRGAGTRRVKTFSSFVFNGSSKPSQGVTICCSINCCERMHEVDQENVFSVPDKGRHDFFTEIEVLKFLVLGKCVWRHCSDCCLN